MTSITNNLKIDSDAPLNEYGQTPSQVQDILAHVERIRKYNVKVLSQSPLYQARAAKNPHYWKEIGNMGLWNVPDDFDETEYTEPL